MKKLMNLFLCLIVFAACVACGKGSTSSPDWRVTTNYDEVGTELRLRGAKRAVMLLDFSPSDVGACNALRAAVEKKGYKQQGYELLLYRVSNPFVRGIFNGDGRSTCVPLVVEKHPQHQLAIAPLADLQ